MIRYLDGLKETEDFKDYPALILYENEENETYPNHWHPSMEIIMPTENEFRVSIGETNYVLSVGDMMFIAPGVLHHLHASEGKRVIMLADFTRLNNLTHAISPINSFIHPAVVITSRDNPDVYDQCYALIYNMRKIYPSSELFREVTIYANLLQLITLVGRACAAGMSEADKQYPDKKQAYIDRFIKICEYIDIHYSEDLTLESIAELAGFSKYHFERLFKNFTGVTFYKYLNRVRISQSRALIADPNLTMTEVALRSGFNTSSTFIRMFKQFNGCTPSEFRNNYRP